MGKLNKNNGGLISQTSYSASEEGILQYILNGGGADGEIL